MSDLERRLRGAAEEIRQAAARSLPPGLGRRTQWRGWMTFAAAFATVVLALGVLPLLTAPDSAPPLAGSDTTTTTTDGATTTVPSTVPGCSAAGLTAPGPQQGLPGPVADKRAAIIEAAVACDFETLRQLASPNLNTSFGGGDGIENLQVWEAEGKEVLAVLVKLLDTPYGVQEFEDAPTHYVWPTAFVYDHWEDIPDTDLAALLTIYTEDELDQLSGFGSYAGWRIGITEAGEWRFFVAGD